MSQFFNPRRLVILVILVLLALAVVGITKNRAELSSLEKIVIDSTAPIQRVWTGITNSLAKGWQGIAEIRQLKQQRDELAKMVRELRNENRQFTETRLENERLKRMLGFQEKSPYQTLPARVIGRSVNNWFSFLTIDQGVNAGVRKGMTVITVNGLVGQINAVSNNTAQVLMILDQSSAVSGLIQESRENGIVEGTSKPDGTLIMQRLPRDAKVKKGDHVFSSGLGGIFPKGIFIGRVAKVERETYDISKKAVVIPAENFNTLEEVLVITNNTPVKPLTPVEGDENQ